MLKVSEQTADTLKVLLVIKGQKGAGRVIWDEKKIAAKTFRMNQSLGDRKSEAHAEIFNNRIRILKIIGLEFSK